MRGWNELQTELRRKCVEYMDLITRSQSPGKMRGWNELPTELKRKCVEHMDLITRFRFQACSLASYNLFRSIRTEFPRVRFGEKQGRYLILIYTDVAKFLRLEFCKENEETVVYRSLDTLKNTYRKVLPYPDHYEIAVLTLKSLILRPNVTVDTFEWNIGIGAENHDRFNEIVGGARMRVRTVSYCLSIGYDRSVSAAELYDYIGPERLMSQGEDGYPEEDDVPVFNICLAVWPKVLFSYMCYQDQVRVVELKTMSPREKLEEVVTKSESSLNSGEYPVTAAFLIFSKEEEKAIFDELPLEVTRADEVEVKCRPSSRYPDLVHYFKYSPLCGFSFELVHKDQDPNKEPGRTSGTCIRGFSCRHHESRFQQWLIQQPPRYSSEPFWGNLEEEMKEPDELAASLKMFFIISVLVVFLASLPSYIVVSLWPK